MEIDDALARGAVGVTTNPILVPQALKARPGRWADAVGRAVREARDPREKAESLVRIVVTDAAEKLRPVFDKSSGESGYVCAQVDPSLAGDRAGMYEMGRRLAAWAPNIAVKLPVTAAGLDVLQRLCSEGITVTATVSFTVAQAAAVAERYQAVLDGRGPGGGGTRGGGRPEGRCFAVLMIGRLDDYLRDAFRDGNAGVAEGDIQQAGVAVAKHAVEIYRKRGFKARLMIAAFRQTSQVAALCGADAVLSIHPRYQKLLVEESLPREQQISREIPADVLRRLSAQDEFSRSFRVDGLSPGQFLTWGLTQRTLAQFTESGWKLLESYA